MNASAPADAASPCRHLPAQVGASPSSPGAKRVPFGWQAVAIGADPVPLRWPDLPAEARPTRLRVTVAIDVRGERFVEAVLAGSGRVLGIIEARNPAVLQPCEIPLLAGDAAELRSDGVVLRLAGGGEPLWVLVDGAGIDPAQRPHLLVPGAADVLAEFHARFASTASLQPFGWMEGCVLDGLLDLADLPGHGGAREVARRHLGLFIRDGRLVYEGPKSDPSDGAIHGIEETLPFAALARLEPGHPLLELPLGWWPGRADAEGAVIDWISTTSEGSYTVAYPLAIIARQRRDDALERLALAQVRLRQQRLFVAGDLWRVSRSDGTRANRNWARGIAWHLLGAVRTLGVLGDRADLAELRSGLAALADWACAHQRRDGLWSVFVDEPELTQDTAGSAGIAAALALGAGQGLFPASARAAARRTLTALAAHLTADGLLGGASASNKAGEGLQRSSYRILYPMGMGLVAQLIAALERP